MEGGRGGTNGERRSLGGDPLARGARVAPGLSPWPGKAFKAYCIGTLAVHASPQITNERGALRRARSDKRL